jgi:hypothetical protein
MTAFVLPDLGRLFVFIDIPGSFLRIVRATQARESGPLPRGEGVGLRRFYQPEDDG